jgi:hypothetical protein
LQAALLHRIYADASNIHAQTQLFSVVLISDLVFLEDFARANQIEILTDGQPVELEAPDMC